MNRYLLLLLLAVWATDLKQSFLQTNDQYIVEEYKTLSDNSAEGHEEMTQYKKEMIIDEDPEELPRKSSKSIRHSATVTEEGVTFDFVMDDEESNKKPTIRLESVGDQEITIDGNRYRIVQGDYRNDEITNEGSFLGEILDAGHYDEDRNVRIVQDNDINNNVYVYQDGRILDNRRVVLQQPNRRQVIIGDSVYGNNLQPVYVGGTVIQRNANPVLIDNSIPGTVIRPVQIDGGIVQPPRYVAVKPQKEYILYRP